MTDLVNLYFNFWSAAIPYKDGYLPVFPEYTVPVNTPLPYLTYTVNRAEMFGNMLESARIWTRSPNIQQVSELSGWAKKAIPIGGVVLFLPDNKGAIRFCRPDAPTPFIQRQPMDEPDLQVNYINIQTTNYMKG